MSRPVLCGAELLEQVAATQPGDEHLAWWWLGQSGYLLRWRNSTICVDPYLSDYLAVKQNQGQRTYERLLLAAFEAAEFNFCDLVVITHQHADHCDPVGLPALMKASREAILVLPAPLSDYATDTLGLPAERVVPIRDGQVFEHQEVRVNAVAAAHERLDLDADGNCSCLSYVLQCEVLSALFVGGTMPYHGQEAKLAAFRPQVAALPINGRSARKQALGLTGNLTIAETARLAADLGVERVIPNHYGMFAENNADPEDFVNHCAEHHPQLAPVVLQPGERWIYP